MVNSGLSLQVHHLFAVYSGGKLDLDGGGYQPNVGMTGPGVGIGIYNKVIQNIQNIRHIYMLHEEA